jgi:hypothetical protein
MDKRAIPAATDGKVVSSQWAEGGGFAGRLCHPQDPRLPPFIEMIRKVKDDGICDYSYGVGLK